MPVRAAIVRQAAPTGQLGSSIDEAHHRSFTDL
jgi:hypothetical protein